MRSSPVSEPLDLAAGLPTTAEDVAMLARPRRLAAPNLLERMNDVSAGRLGFPFPPRRTTSAGFEPFEL